jgi:hypothetical protein
MCTVYAPIVFTVYRQSHYLAKPVGQRNILWENYARMVLVLSACAILPTTVIKL